jgi:hypothetical protein
MELQWSVSLEDGGECHSIEIPGAYADVYDKARALAYLRIATLEPGTLIEPPGIVGRGDHVYVEIHVRHSARIVVNVTGSLVDGLMPPAVEAIATQPLDPDPAA